MSGIHFDDNMRDLKIKINMNNSASDRGIDNQEKYRKGVESVVKFH